MSAAAKATTDTPVGYMWTIPSADSAARSPIQAASLPVPAILPSGRFASGSMRLLAEDADLLKLPYQQYGRWETYSHIFPQSLRFTADGRVSYVAVPGPDDRDAPKTRQAVVLVIEDQEVQKLWEGPCRDPGGRSAWTEPVDLNKPSLGTYLFLEGICYGRYQGLGQLATSADGQHVIGRSRTRLHLAAPARAASAARAGPVAGRSGAHLVFVQALPLAQGLSL